MKGMFFMLQFHPKFLCIAAALSLMLASLSACSLTKTDPLTEAPVSSGISAEGTTGETTQEATENVTEEVTENTTQDVSESPTSEDVSVSAGGKESSDLFTTRDKEVGWNESEAVNVTLSDGGTSVSGAGVTVSGSTVTITEEGTYVLSGALSEGQVIVDIDKNDKVQLVLKNVNITSASSAPLYVKSADKVFVTLAPGSENTLINAGAFVAIDENKIDGCVYSKEDITFNGNGTLHIACAAGHGIVSKDSLVFTGGTYNISAAKHGLQGKDDIRILDGTLNVVSGEDGLHCENDDDNELGFIYIEGGTLNISSEDDGIHAGNYLTVENGYINIAKSYEGLEAKKITIDGGEFHIVASDDGINAAGGSSGAGFGYWGMFGGSGSSDFELNINGGVVYVNAGGDGVDSNGTLSVTGGEVYVSGPTNSGNGALDYETNGVITGGTVVAAGAVGMAENFGTSSTQCSALISLSGSGGDTITLKDASGNILVTFTPEKDFQCVVISTPELREGETYTLTAGNNSTSFTLTSAIYSEVGGMGGPGGFGGMGGQMPGNPGGNQGGFPGRR